MTSIDENGTNNSLPWEAIARRLCDAPIWWLLGAWYVPCPDCLRALYCTVVGVRSRACRLAKDSLELLSGPPASASQGLGLWVRVPGVYGAGD